MPRVRKSFENSTTTTTSALEYASGICCISECGRVGTRLLSSLRGSYPLKNSSNNAVRRVCEGHYRKDLRHHKLRETNPVSFKKKMLSKASLSEESEDDFIAVPISYSEPNSPTSETSSGSPVSPLSLSPTSSSPSSTLGTSDQYLYNTYYTQLVAAYLYYQQQYHQQQVSPSESDSPTTLVTQQALPISTSSSTTDSSNLEYEFDEATVGKCNRFRSFCEFVLKIESVI